MNDLPVRTEEVRDGGRGRSRERSLMERIHAGESQAMDELLQRYWLPLVRYVSRFLQSRDAAEDVVQETMLRVWEGRAEWTPSHRLQSFLYRIARNLALNERDKGRVRKAWADSQSREVPEPEPTPLDLTERRELQERLDSLVSALPPKRREVFILSRYHGHTYREIAEIMDISPQTVANQMTAALDRLRTHLRPEIQLYLSRSRIRLVDPQRSSHRE